MEGYLTQASRWVEKTSLADLPEDVILDGKRSLMDTLGCIIGGSQREPISRMIALFEGISPNRSASVLGRREKLDPLFAAMVNGTAATWLDFDSGHRHPSVNPPVAGIHPPAHTIPAALAVGEKLGTPGKAFLEGYILGYEISARIGIASKLRPGFHVFGTQAILAAPVHIGKMLGYDAARIERVINVASSLTFATSMQAAIEGATVRNLYSGLGAFNGLLATYLLDCGITGEKDGVASVFGKVSATDFNPLMVVADLGKDFESTKGYYKIHACCRWNHPALDALQSIRQRRHVTPEEVERIDVETFQFATSIANKEPVGELQAKFSLPHAFAALIVLGSTDPHSFVEEAISNPQILALAQKVEIEENPSYQAMLPDYRPTRVIVSFKDGSSESEMVWGALGDPRRRFPPEWLEEKFMANCGEVVGKDKAARALATIMRLEEIEDICQLTELLVQD